MDLLLHELLYQVLSPLHYLPAFVFQFKWLLLNFIQSFQYSGGDWKSFAHFGCSWKFFKFNFDIFLTCYMVIRFGYFRSTVGSRALCGCRCVCVVYVYGVCKDVGIMNGVYKDVCSVYGKWESSWNITPKTILKVQILVLSKVGMLVDLRLILSNK